MTAPVYIGDEISASGWRLAGARVALPGRGDETAALAAACATAPLMLVVPDPQGEVTLPDLAARLRGQLGLEP